jgi:hypothetical protein
MVLHVQPLALACLPGDLENWWAKYESGRIAFIYIFASLELYWIFSSTAVYIIHGMLVCHGDYYILDTYNIFLALGITGRTATRFRTCLEPELSDKFFSNRWTVLAMPRHRRYLRLFPDISRNTGRM